MRDRHTKRARALREHMAICSRGASAYELGLYYRDLLSGTGVWQTQAELAQAMNVSRAHVSKCLAAARLPQEIVSLFGPEMITFRLAASLTRLIDELGLEHLLVNATRLPNVALGTVDILTVLVAGESAEATDQVRLRVGRGKALRLELPDPGIVLPHLRQLERMIAWSISMVLSVPSNGARPTRRYKRRVRSKSAAVHREVI